MTVGLISSTQTTIGLMVVCVRDNAEYELTKKISDEKNATINIRLLAKLIIVGFVFFVVGVCLL